jgi:hypothetical protein
MKSSCSLDKSEKRAYNGPMFKKLIVISSFLLLTGLFVPASSRAAEVTTETTCTTVTQYGGSVTYVCGAHTPVETGLAESLPLIGFLSLGASGLLRFLSKRVKLD